MGQLSNIKPSERLDTLWNGTSKIMHIFSSLFSFTRNMENFLECFPKIRVEYGVDKRIDNGVDVTQPGGNEKHIHTRLNLR